jgi:hypothetical protein
MPSQDVVCVFRPESPGRDYELHLDLAASSASRRGALIVSCSSSERRGEVVCSVDKKYNAAVMHGFTVKYEPGVFDHHEDLRGILDDDLKEVRSC